MGAVTRALGLERDPRREADEAAAALDAARQAWTTAETDAAWSAYKRAETEAQRADLRLRAHVEAERRAAETAAAERRAAEEARLAALVAAANGYAASVDAEVRELVKLERRAAALHDSMTQKASAQALACREAEETARRLGVEVPALAPVHQGNIAGLVNRAIRDNLRRTGAAASAAWSLLRAAD